MNGTNYTIQGQPNNSEAFVVCYSAPSPECLQDVGRFLDFRSNWMFSRAVDARSTSSDISSVSYLQLYSSFLVLEAEDPPLRSDVCDDEIDLPIGGRLPTDDDGGLLMFRFSVFSDGSDSELIILIPPILV